MWGVTLGAKDIGALAASTGESTLLLLDMKTSLGEHLAKMLEKESSVWDGNDLELFRSLQISNFSFLPPLTPLPRPSGEQSQEVTLFIYEGTFWATVPGKHEEAWLRKERKTQPKIYHELYIAIGSLGPLRSTHNAIQFPIQEMRRVTMVMSSNPIPSLLIIRVATQGANSLVLPVHAHQGGEWTLG